MMHFLLLACPTNSFIFCNCLSYLLLAAENHFGSVDCFATVGGADSFVPVASGVNVDSFLTLETIVDR